jgi:penicillin-binding protein 1A
MDLILVKIFATALALSQVTTQPQAIKTHFDPAKDQDEVVQILRSGCAHMKQAFDIESINVDDLIATALDDPKAVGADIKAFHGLNFADLNTAYHQFCKNEPITNPVVDMRQVIDFFNNAAADLPDQNILKGKRLPSMSVVLDGNGRDFADVFESGNRRIWTSLADIPEPVQKAFVAAEDRRFYAHHGVDERGIIRAFVGNLADPKRPQGGSTITQQVVKNLLVGDDVSYERKIREMIVASRLENTLGKNDILELYLNSAYLGRGSWGIEMAARSYFGKSAKNLTVPEGAMLAGLLKGPNYYNPDRHADRARERLSYVLERMAEDGAISAAQKDEALVAPPKLVAYQLPRRDTGFHFVDFVGREAKADGVASLTARSYTVHSTIDAQLQRDTEAALQEGLARYELSTGRMQFRGPEANIGDAVRKLESDNRAGMPATTPTATSAATPAWQQALQAARLPLYDVHWTPAVVLSKGGGKKGDEAIRVGLPDGRILPLTVWSAAIRRGLGLYDVVYVHVVESKVVESKAIESKSRSKATSSGAVQTGGQAQLRVRPTVQGAALVLENQTGRILAMAGSFSYPRSQLNRVAQSQRQPGSAMKPLTYLTALQHGLQPNTLVPNEPITLAPIGSDGRDIISRDYGGYGGYARPQDYWSPRNADYNEGGLFTMRRGLENSINVVTAHLLEGGISDSPEKSLDAVCATAVAAKIYSECVRYYPFVLGAQPVRMIDLAAFYAAVANEGALPQPHGIDSIEEDGHTVYEYPKTPLPWIGAADRASFYQLKTMLQGVVARGTARAVAGLSPYIAGKTGTTEDAVDGWFIGFTNDVTVAVWVGYDNADHKRRSLGTNATGARVALPIFEPIIQAIWAEHIAPKTLLRGPSPEARKMLADAPIDYYSGNRVAGGGFVEHFRRDAAGQIEDTQYQLASGYGGYYEGDQWGYNEGSSNWGGYNRNGQWIGRSYYPNWRSLPPQPAPASRGLFQPWRWSDNPSPTREFFWGGRVN